MLSGVVTLDVAPLARAIDRLREGLARHRQHATDEQLRDGLIQRFEFTYELAHRTLQRFLRETAASPEAYDLLNFADLIRAGNHRGLLLSDWPTWRGFRDIRARTGHTYDAAAAHVVVSVIPSFLSEVTHLCAELQRRLS